MQTAAAPRRAQLLANFETPRYYAALHPLRHLHVTFRGLPHLEALFPPPEGAVEATRPVSFEA